MPTLSRDRPLLGQSLYTEPRQGAKVTEAQPGRDLNGLISAACTGLLRDFRRLRGLFVESHSEMDATAIAINLMEFGRGQISGIEQPSEDDSSFIEEHVATIQVDGELAHQFCAYVSGCVLGWVLAGELPRDDLEPALAIVQSQAQAHFPQDSTAEP